MRTEHELSLLLYAQSALLGEIAPTFRAISFNVSDKGNYLQSRFIVDGEPSEETRGVISVIMTNVFANYSINHYQYKEEILALPFPQKMEHLKLLVYLRNEDDWNSWSKLYTST